MHKNYNVLLAKSYLFKDAPKASQKKPTADYAYKHFKLFNYIITPTDFSDTYIGFKPHNLYTENIPLNKPFDLDNDTIYSTYALNDTIFVIGKEQIWPKFFVNFGVNRIPREYTIGKNEDVLLKLYRDKDAKWAGVLDRIVISKKFVGFSYGTAIKFENSSLYLTSSKQTINFNQVENDLNGGPLGIIAGKYSDDTLIGFMEAYEFLKNPRGKCSPEITDMLNSVEHNDNPILTTIKVK